MFVGKCNIFCKNCEEIICPVLQQNAFSVYFREISIFRKACSTDYETVIGARTGKQFNPR
jgi:hypothetical protein